MKTEQIQYNSGLVQHNAVVKHNLDKMGLSLEAALINWAARTKNPDPESFAEYVKSKDPKIKCEILAATTMTAL